MSKDSYDPDAWKAWDGAITRIAKEIAPQLDALYGDCEDPEQMHKIVEVMWENKMGILRVLQAVAAN